MSQPAFLAPLTIPASGTHTHTLIFLHGRGDTAPIFGPIFHSDLYGTAQFPGLKFIFPTPSETFSLVFRRRIRQWFDFFHGTPPESYTPQQLEGLKEVVEHVGELIDGEEVPVLLGGLSQGCAVAVMTLLLGGKKVQGVVGMSGWMPFAEEIMKGLAGHEEEWERIRLLGRLREMVLKEPPLEDQVVSEVLRTPVWLGHGDADRVVAYQVGLEMRMAFERLRMDVQWTRYPGFEHWYKVPEEFEDVVRFWREKCGMRAVGYIGGVGEMF